jgi:Rrf2 family transcriptional regulator, iron-sulfur cluster assembly transcription factor
MRMSTKGRFAVNALIDLALHAKSGPVALVSISRRQRVSLSYLEQLFSRLRRDGIVNSMRGPGGGYTLGRTAEEISVADIVTAVDDLTPGANEPSRQGDSATLDTPALWQRLNEVMLAHMATITLASQVQAHVEMGGAAAETSSTDRPIRRLLAPRPAPRPAHTNAPNSVFAFGRSFAR